MEHRWAEPGLAEEGPHPREDQRQVGVMRVWSPQSDLEPEFNCETSSAAALSSRAMSSQPQWEVGVVLPRMPCCGGEGGMCHSRFWALQGR